MENYLMLNGQKIELTDSQYKEIMNAIGGSAPTKENPFARRRVEDYHAIHACGRVYTYNDWGTEDDDSCYENANYCSDKDLLTRRAFYEKVERNLWRFSMENGGSGKYIIQYNKDKEFWDWDTCQIFKYFGPTFASKEVVFRAIDEILVPMLEKENIDPTDLFEWKI